jgi:hypothetical protein
MDSVQNFDFGDCCMMHQNGHTIIILMIIIIMNIIIIIIMNIMIIRIMVSPAQSSGCH